MAAQQEPLFAHRKGDEPPPYSTHNCYYQNEVQSLRDELKRAVEDRKVDLRRMEETRQADFDRMQHIIGDLVEQSQQDRNAVKDLKLSSQRDQKTIADLRTANQRAQTAIDGLNAQISQLQKKTANECLKHQFVQHKDKVYAQLQQLNDRFTGQIETLRKNDDKLCGFDNQQQEEIDCLRKQLQSKPKLVAKPRLTRTPSGRCTHTSHVDNCTACRARQSSVGWCSKHGQIGPHCSVCATSRAASAPGGNMT